MNIVFLDIKVKEPTDESLTKKVRQYMDPKFMSVKEAAMQLVKIIENNPRTGNITFAIFFKTHTLEIIRTRTLFRL